MDENPATHFIDLSAASIGVAAFFQYLPSAAALLSVVWLILRIVESKTVQQALGKYRWLKETKTSGDDD